MTYVAQLLLAFCQIALTSFEKMMVVELHRFITILFYVANNIVKIRFYSEDLLSSDNQ